jgi:hypothetical protein
MATNSSSFKFSIISRKLIIISPTIYTQCFPCDIYFSPGILSVDVLVEKAFVERLGMPAWLYISHHRSCRWSDGSLLLCEV